MLQKEKLGLEMLGLVIALFVAYHINIQLECQKIVKNYNESYVVEGMTEFDKINSNREYVYANSVFANGEDLLLNGFSYEIFGLSKKEKVVKMFKLSENFKGGLYCDGFADMLAMLYQTMGYDAYRVNLDIYIW